MSPKDFAKGPALAVLTAVICQQGISTRRLSSWLDQSATQLQHTLAACQAHHWITPDKRGGWVVTNLGISVFYHTMRHITDVLSPQQEAPTLPFTMATTWRECVCLNYIVESALLKRLISPVFEPVIHQGYGIVSVTISSIVNMRPRGMPALAGKSFCNVSYRAVVRCKDAAGQWVEGYEFIKSATNSPLFTQIGNTVTEFRFHDFSTGWIHFLRQGQRLIVGVEVPGESLDTIVAIDDLNGAQTPPETSIFASRAELDRVVLDHTDAFGYIPQETFVYILRIIRSPWHYTFIEPKGCYSAFFQESTPFGSDTATLDSVLHCSDIEYQWCPLIKQALHPDVVPRRLL